jgi:hypothetical protein
VKHIERSTQPQPDVCYGLNGTFTIYDRAERPFLYWTGKISMPIILAVSLSLSLLLTLSLWPLWLSSRRFYRFGSKAGLGGNSK